MSTSVPQPVFDKDHNHLFVHDAAQKQVHLERIGPAIAALEQMRMKALERLDFEGQQIHDTWYKTASFTANQKVLNQKAMARVNQGIDEMIQALSDGKVNTLLEAFDHFDRYTSLRSWQGEAWAGAAFRQLLLENAGDVDVKRLMAWSHFTDPSEREHALLDYTIDLRNSPLLSLRGYPANTILTNLQALRHAHDPTVREKADTLYDNATGEKALTGLSDAAHATLLREGAKSTVPMALAMMLAGPVGAYAEGTVAATRFTSAGRTIWNGTNAAGKAGWIARGSGFATEATVFWGATDVAHALLLGGGDYFTKHGLLSSSMMLGGFRILAKSWQATGGAYLLTAAQRSPHLLAPIKLTNHAGALATEWGGFWGIAQLEQLIGLTPPQETSLRQELAEAAISLMQLKIAVASGQAMTSHYSHLKILEIKLDTAERCFNTALQDGRMTAQATQKAFAHIFSLRTMLHRLKQNEPVMAHDSWNEPARHRWSRALGLQWQRLTYRLGGNTFDPDLIQRFVAEKRGDLGVLSQEELALLRQIEGISKDQIGTLALLEEYRGPRGSLAQYFQTYADWFAAAKAGRFSVTDWIGFDGFEEVRSLWKGYEAKGWKIEPYFGTLLKEGRGAQVFPAEKRVLFRIAPSDEALPLVIAEEILHLEAMELIDRNDGKVEKWVRERIGEHVYRDLLV